MNFDGFFDYSFQEDSLVDLEKKLETLNSCVNFKNPKFVKNSKKYISKLFSVLSDFINQDKKDKALLILKELDSRFKECQSYENSISNEFIKNFLKIFELIQDKDQEEYEQFQKIIFDNVEHAYKFQNKTKIEYFCERKNELIFKLKIESFEKLIKHSNTMSKKEKKYFVDCVKILKKMNDVKIEDSTYSENRKKIFKILDTKKKIELFLKISSKDLNKKQREFALEKLVCMREHKDVKIYLDLSMEEFNLILNKIHRNKKARNNRDIVNIYVKLHKLKAQLDKSDKIKNDKIDAILKTTKNFILDEKITETKFGLFRMTSFSSYLKKYGINFVVVKPRIQDETKFSDSALELLFQNIINLNDSQQPQTKISLKKSSVANVYGDDKKYGQKVFVDQKKDFCQKNQSEVNEVIFPRYNEKHEPIDPWVNWGKIFDDTLEIGKTKNKNVSRNVKLIKLVKNKDVSRNVRSTNVSGRK